MNGPKVRDTVEDMAPREKTTQVTFRLADTLLERLDAYAKRLDKDNPGLSHSRADAVRVLLTRGLDEADEEAPKKSKR